MRSPNDILLKVEKILKNTNTTKQKHKVLGTRRDIPLFRNTIVQFCYLYNLWISLFSCTYFLKTMLNLYVFFPYRFYSRDSGLLKFKIHAGFLGRPIPPTGKRLVAFTFHPLYPFAISVQKTNAEYVVNFHIRHLTSGVEHS